MHGGHVLCGAAGWAGAGAGDVVIKTQSSDSGVEMESLAGIVMGSPWSLAAAVFVQQSSSYFLGLVLGRWRVEEVSTERV